MSTESYMTNFKTREIEGVISDPKLCVLNVKTDALNNVRAWEYDFVVCGYLSNITVLFRGNGDILDCVEKVYLSYENKVIEIGKSISDDERVIEFPAVAFIPCEKGLKVTVLFSRDHSYETNMVRVLADICIDNESVVPLPATWEFTLPSIAVRKTNELEIIGKTIANFDYDIEQDFHESIYESVSERIFSNRPVEMDVRDLLDLDINSQNTIEMFIEWKSQRELLKSSAEHT